MSKLLDSDQLSPKHFWRLIDRQHIGNGQWKYIEHGLFMYDVGLLQMENKLIWSIIAITFALNILFIGYCCFKRKRGPLIYTEIDVDVYFDNCDSDTLETDYGVKQNVSRNNNDNDDDDCKYDETELDEQYL